MSNALLVLWVCTLGTPEICDKRRVALEMTRSQCDQSVIALVAQWSEEHPNVTVRRWKCTEPEEDV